MTWTSEIVATGGWAGLNASLAFDPITQEPAIAYRDPANEHTRFAIFQNGSWNLSSFPEIPNINSGDLAFSPSGYPVFAYQEAYGVPGVLIPPHRIRYARFNGIKWDTLTAYDNASPPGSARAVEIRFNPHGQPAIAYAAFHLRFVEQVRP